jgi:hypothetical protein
MEFKAARGWDCPDGTVLVKSFALEMEEGNPESRRWVETRFLTNQQGEWFGYSYAWDDAQADGTLVEVTGRDREFAIKVPRSKDHPDGIRKQTWHYPSRAECLVCHSRAANFVLGLSSVQMNKEHDYGGARDNQLRVLERLGLLHVPAEEARAALRDGLEAQGLSEKEANAALEKLSSAAKPGTSPLVTFSMEKYRRLVDPSDAKAEVAARARSYLHANCAQCHVEAGGGNAQMELEFTTALAKARVRDVKPVHDSYGLPEARLVAPGHPERSVLLHRMSHRGAGHMPPLATAVVDDEAVALLRTWIEQLKPSK